MSSAALRPARLGDMGEVAAIYGHHVLHGLASFEESPPDEAEITRRFTALCDQGYPYIVAEEAGVVLGYGYLGPYRPRPAYRFSVENSVYIAPAAARKGLGSAVLTRLIGEGTVLGYRQMVAVIGDSANAPSINLHAKHGFVQAGLILSVGYKFGRWVDSVIMQRALGQGDETPPEKLLSRKDS